MIEFTEDTDGYLAGSRHSLGAGIEDAYVVYRRTAKYVTDPAEEPKADPDAKSDSKFSDARADKMTRPEQVKRK